MGLNREKIFIDVDETLARTIEDWVYPFVNNTYWTNFSFQTTHDYRDIFWDVIQQDWVPISLEKKIEIFKSAVENDIWKNLIRPVSWSVNKILQLSEWFSLGMLTARHPEHIDYTIEWSKLHYNWAFNQLFSSNCYHGWKVTKPNICKQEDVKIIIEDDIDYALELAKEKIKVFLLLKPWNRHRKENHRNIQRVDCWDDIKI